MPNEMRMVILHDWQIIKARGRAAIIPFIKYFEATGIHPYVLHNRDTNTPGSVKFNQLILSLLKGDKPHRFTDDDDIENILEFGHYSQNKPFKAYKQY